MKCPPAGMKEHHNLAVKGAPQDNKDSHVKESCNTLMIIGNDHQNVKIFNIY
jgi:hypothetical protein